MTKKPRKSGSVPTPPASFVPSQSPWYDLTTDQTNTRFRQIFTDASERYEPGQPIELETATRHLLNHVYRQQDGERALLAALAAAAMGMQYALTLGQQLAEAHGAPNIADGIRNSVDLEDLEQQLRGDRE